MLAILPTAIGTSIMCWSDQPFVSLTAESTSWIAQWDGGLGRSLLTDRGRTWGRDVSTNY